MKKMQIIFAALLGLGSVVRAGARQETELKLATDRSSYQVGEPVLVSVSWKNATDKTQKIADWLTTSIGLPQLNALADPCLHLLVTREDRPAKFLGPFLDSRSRGAPSLGLVDLLPGQEKQFTHAINARTGLHYDLDSPGTYRIAAARCPQGGEAIETGRGLLSSAVEITIRPGLSTSSAREFEFSLAADKKVYSIGEPVAVTFTWENKTSRTLRLPTWGGPNHGVARLDSLGRVLDFEAIKEDGSRLAFRSSAYDYEDQTRENYFQLGPGKTHAETYTISGVYGAYDFLWEGNYSLRAAYAGDGDHLQTDGVKITVKAPDPKSFDRSKTLARRGDMSALYFIWANRYSEGIPALLYAFPACNLDCKNMILRALARIGNDRSVDAFAVLLGSARPAERVGIIKALSETENRRALDVVAPLADSSDPEIRDAASKALKKMNGERP